MRIGQRDTCRRGPPGSAWRSRRTARGSGCVAPSTVTWCSAIASSSALCVRGGARLISSASSTWANTGPGWNSELSRLRVEHRHADDVGRQQVGGELHALEAEPERRRQRMRERGLAQARQVLDQQVAAGQQRHERQPHFLRLAQHQRVDLRLRAVRGPRAGRSVSMCAVTGAHARACVCSWSAIRSVARTRAMRDAGTNQRRRNVPSCALWVAVLLLKLVLAAHAAAVRRRGVLLAGRPAPGLRPIPTCPA